MIFNKNFKILIFTQLKVVVESVTTDQRRNSRREKVKRRMEGKVERRNSRREKGPTTTEVIFF